MTSIASLNPTGTVAAGRYVIYFAGRECGDERWQVVRTHEGFVVTGEQVTVAPHPFPSTQEYRATFTPAGRPSGLEILWRVGERIVRSLHEAGRERWHVRIEYADHVREQEGDFPDYCEIEYATPLVKTFMFARRDYAVGGEHEYPALLIGPPYMAVEPTRLLCRCVESGVVETAFGRVPAKRYVLSRTPQPEEPGYAFWADEHGVVLESYEGLEAARPWMRLVEYQRWDEAL
jgi:hypothetical protein